ncbi:hypothetical protein [Sphaerotilus sp.]|uniref:hypothetical protein n=1 Tax=Sphaerotilus sp. TaxID=2093942 RepID=UPI00286EABA2|nr:hypothetical protein [Sphaerotilus sp.]
MNAIVIQHVPLSALPPAWQERLSSEGMTHGLVTVRIEEEAQIESAHDTDTAPIRDARTRLRGSVLRYDNPLEPVLDDQPHPVREGWAEAARTIAERGEDTLVMGEFSNEGDDTAIAWEHPATASR